MKGDKNQYGPRKSLKERLEAKLMPIPESGCLIWIGGTSNYGHGSIGNGKGRCIPTHRAAWMVYRGEIPEGMCILHKCDVPPCCNPDHLFIGTQIDNIADRHKKDRDNHKPNVYGETHPYAKLTNEQAREIKFGPETQAFYHRKYGVPRQLVSDIRCGKTWKHIQ